MKNYLLRAYNYLGFDRSSWIVWLKVKFSLRWEWSGQSVLTNANALMFYWYWKHYRIKQTFGQTVKNICKTVTSSNRQLHVHLKAFNTCSNEYWSWFWRCSFSSWIAVILLKYHFLAFSMTWRPLCKRSCSSSNSFNRASCNKTDKQIAIYIKMNRQIGNSNNYYYFVAFSGMRVKIAYFWKIPIIINFWKWIYFYYMHISSNNLKN